MKWYDEMHAWYDVGRKQEMRWEMIGVKMGCCYLTRKETFNSTSTTNNTHTQEKSRDIS